MIAIELPHLVELPGLMIEAGDAAKQERRAVAVAFVIDFRIQQSQMRHHSSAYGRLDETSTRTEPASFSPSGRRVV